MLFRSSISMPLLPGTACSEGNVLTTISLFDKELIAGVCWRAGTRSLSACTSSWTNLMTHIPHSMRLHPRMLPSTEPPPHKPPSLQPLQQTKGHQLWCKVGYSAYLYICRYPTSSMPLDRSFSLSWHLFILKQSRHSCDTGALLQC